MNLFLKLYRQRLEKLKEMVIHEMTNAVKLDIPLKVDWVTGKTGWKHINF